MEFIVACLGFWLFLFIGSSIFGKGSRDAFVAERNARLLPKDQRPLRFK